MRSDIHLGHENFLWTFFLPPPPSTESRFKQRNPNRFVLRYTVARLVTSSVFRLRVYRWTYYDYRFERRNPNRITSFKHISPL